MLLDKDMEVHYALTLHFSKLRQCLQYFFNFTHVPKILERALWLFQFPMHLCTRIADMLILPTCPFPQRIITWIRPCTSPVLRCGWIWGNLIQPHPLMWRRSLLKWSGWLEEQFRQRISDSIRNLVPEGAIVCRRKHPRVPQWNTKPCFEAGQVILYRCIWQFMLSDHCDMGFEIEIFLVDNFYKIA